MLCYVMLCDIEMYIGLDWIWIGGKSLYNESETIHFTANIPVGHAICE